MDVWPIAMPYWAAFHDLSEQRELGFSGVGSIRLEAIYAWLTEHGITDEQEREDYTMYVQSLDREYRGLVAKANEKSPASVDPNDSKSMRSLR